MAISKKTWFGIARETTPGTAIATPTKFVPCKSTMKGAIKMVNLDEERDTRDDVFGVVNTTRDGTWDVKGNFYADSHGYFLLGALGAVTSTQPDSTNNPTVYKHAFSLADVPPSFTLFKGYDTFIYYGPYGVVEKFTIKIQSEGKLIEFDASMKSIFPVDYTGGAITPTYSTIHPFIGYAPTITLNGVQSTDIDDLQIDFTQKITEWYPAAGSPDWITAYFGGRDVKLDFTARFDQNTQWENFRNGAVVPVIVDVKGDLISGTFYDEFSITLPYFHIDSAELDTSKDNVLVKVKGTAFNGGTNGLIETCFLQNTYTGYTS
jgi:hypothetical protein